MKVLGMLSNEVSVVFVTVLEVIWRENGAYIQQVLKKKPMGLV
jgi:hypothetical protein